MLNNVCIKVDELRGESSRFLMGHWDLVDTMDLIFEDNLDKLLREVQVVDTGYD
jgi:hypothetical protein